MVNVELVCGSRERLEVFSLYCFSSLSCSYKHYILSSPQVLHSGRIHSHSHFKGTLCLFCAKKMTQNLTFVLSVLGRSDPHVRSCPVEKLQVCFDLILISGLLLSYSKTCVFASLRHLDVTLPETPSEECESSFIHHSSRQMKSSMSRVQSSCRRSER